MRAGLGNVCKSSSLSLGIIYILLYLTYHSLLEAAHVLLAVPFALSGASISCTSGIQHLGGGLGGFIALFGTAVQTAVVMVIYLEEAVVQASGAGGTPDTGSPPGGGD